MKPTTIFVLSLLLASTYTQKPVQKPKRKAKKTGLCAMNAVFHMSKAGQELAFKLTKTQISALTSEYQESTPGTNSATKILTQTFLIHKTTRATGEVHISGKKGVLQKVITKELKYLHDLDHFIKTVEKKEKQNKVAKKGSGKGRLLQQVQKEETKKTVQKMDGDVAVAQYAQVLFQNLKKFEKTDRAFLEMCM